MEKRAIAAVPSVEFWPNLTKFWFNISKIVQFSVKIGWLARLTTCHFLSRKTAKQSLDIRPMDGATLERIVQQTVTTSPEILEKVRKAIEVVETQK